MGKPTGLRSYPHQKEGRKAVSFMTNQHGVISRSLKLQPVGHAAYWFCSLSNDQTLWAGLKMKVITVPL